MVNNPLRYNDPSGHDGGAGAVSDFLLGVVYEITSNNYDGFLIPKNSSLRSSAEELAANEVDNVAFQGGRIIGGAASAVQGAVEIVGGAGTAVGGVGGGLFTSWTGVGAVAGGAVAAVGVGVAVHGAGTYFNGVAGISEAGQNIYNAMAGGGRSSSSSLPDFFINEDQFGEKAGQHLRKNWGLDPGNRANRDWFRNKIEDIAKNYEEVRQGEWRGGVKNAFFYKQGSDVVVAKESGEFITILRDGVSNKFFQGATEIH